jgi:hypothetical protein
VQTLKCRKLVYELDYLSKKSGDAFKILSTMLCCMLALETTSSCSKLAKHFLGVSRNTSISSNDEVMMATLLC